MTTCWFGTRLSSKATKPWLSVLLILFFATAGCQHATEDTEGPDEVSSALFVDFERYYEAPEKEYFHVDSVRAVNPNPEERLPLVLEEDLQKLSPEALERADIRDDGKLIRFPRQEFEAAADMEPGDVVKSGLSADDFWIKITGVEVFEDTIVWHSQHAELDDVVMVGDFFLEVDEGHSIPKGFNLMDVYTRTDVDAYHQTLTDDCLLDEVDDILAEAPSGDAGSFAMARQNHYNNTVKSQHVSWLMQQRAANTDAPLSEETKYDVAADTCTPEVGKNMQSARNSYNGNGTPPSVVCFREWFHDELEQYGRAELDLAPDAPITEVCEGVGASDVDPVEQEGDGDHIGEMFSSETDVLEHTDYGGDYEADLCELACNLADDTESCKSGCTDFEKCAGIFCFRLTDTSISFSPKVKFGFSAGWLYVEASIDVGGELDLTLGAELSAEYSFDWEKSTEFFFGIPPLAFNLGVVSFGVGVYAEFGISFNFDAEATLAVTYNLNYEAGLKVTARVGSSNKFDIDPYFHDNSEGVNVDARGSLSAQLQMWAAAGVSLQAGAGTLLSGGDLIDDVSLPGGRIAWVEPLRAVFSASAAIAPPSCPYDVGIHAGGEIGAELDFGVFSLGPYTMNLWGPEYLWRIQGHLHEFIDPLHYLCGDEVDMEPPVDDAPREQCSDDSECAGGDICSLQTGNCIAGGDPGDVRVTLGWRSLVDLNLVIEDPSGARHAVIPALGSDDAFTRTDCGNLCADQMDSTDPTLTFVENAVLPAQDGKYRMYVVKNDTYPPDVPEDQYRYDIEVAHDGEVHEVGGYIDPEYDEMPVVFEYCVGGSC